MIKLDIWINKIIIINKFILIKIEINIDEIKIIYMNEVIIILDIRVMYINNIINMFILII